MKIFNEILLKHTDIQICRESYVVNNDIGITVDQKENKVVMWAFNYTTDRFVNLGTKRFEKLIDGFKSVASDVYFKNYYCYITLCTMNKDSAVDDKYNEDGIKELKQKVDCLNDDIARLENRNKKLEDEVEKYRQDYLYYHSEWSKLIDRDLKKAMDGLDEIRKLPVKHNARGAGRKSRFSNEQIEEIKSLRESGNTIKEIATRFECSVGLIHKLINEK